LNNVLVSNSTITGSTIQTNTIVNTSTLITSTLTGINIVATGPITATGGITNMGYTSLPSTSFIINWGYTSYPINGSVFYTITGIGKSSDSSFVYVTIPDACSPLTIQGFNLYAGYSASQPQVQAINYVSGPPGPASGVSFNLGGNPLLNNTSYIQFTIYGYK
jgi:hypothetical protein